jgi:protein involved in polysaccharide export with SLBB domain
MKLTLLRSFLPACLLPLLLLAGCYSPEVDNPNPGKRVEFPSGTPPGEVQNPALPAVGPGQTADATGSRASVGDALTVSFSDVPAIGGLPPESRLRVGPDGTITLPFNISILCVGKTAPELQKEIRAAYVPRYFVNLTAAVKFEDRYVFVGGEVRVPQRLVYTGNSLTVLRAIDSAGGFTDFSKRDKIEVRRFGGETVWVNWTKARKDSKLDLPVFPNDQIIVHKKGPFG